METSKQQRLLQLQAALKKKFPGKILVHGSGAVNAKIVFVTQAPDEQEEKAGKLLVGPRAKTISTFLKSMALDRRSVYVTTVLKYRPKKGIALPMKEIKASVPFLREEIKVVDPKVIVTLGPVALTGIGLRQPLHNMHGKSLPFGGYTLFPMFHPVYTKTDETIRANFTADTENFKKLLASLV